MTLEMGCWGATEQLWNAFHNCSVAPQHPHSRAGFRPRPILLFTNQLGVDAYWQALEKLLDAKGEII